MKKTILTAIILVIGLLVPAPEPTGIGGCWELEPLCGPGDKAVCICNSLDVCRWICP